MLLSPYLNFNGQCKAAFTFYQEVLGGQIVMMLTHGETPMAGQGSVEMNDMIVHARLIFGANVLMGSDVPTEYFSKPAGSAASLVVDTPEEAERIFAAFAEDGSVQMPMEETFWAKRFGMLTDRFGTPWIVNCEKPMGA